MTAPRSVLDIAGLRNRVSSPFASVAGGSAIGQIALACSLPVIARLYSPAEIGVFGVLLAYSQVASIAITGRLEQVLPRLALGHRWSTARLVITTGVALGPGAALVAFLLAGRTGWSDYLATAAVVMSLCLYNAATFVMLAAQNFGGVSLLRISNGVATSLAQIAGGLLLSEVWVLLLTYAVGSLAAAALAIPDLVRLRRSRGPDSLRSVIREERLGRFMTNVGSGAVLSNIGLALPLIGVSMLFGNAAAGSFYLARRLLMVPTQLIAASVSEVSYAVLARESADRIAELVFGWLRTSIRLAAALLIIGLAMAPVVSLLVGPGYPDIEWIVVLLTLPAMAQMIATSFSNVLLALHMEVVRTAWNIGRLVGLLGIYVWAAISDASFTLAVAVFSAYTFVTYGILLWLTLRGVRLRRSWG